MLSANRKVYIRHMSYYDMPRKLDENKVTKIKKILRKNTQGLWVREIARKCELDKSTVSVYLSKYMKDEVEVFSISGLVKIYKLKK